MHSIRPELRHTCLLTCILIVGTLATGCGGGGDSPVSLSDRGYGFGPDIDTRIQPNFEPTTDSFFRTPWPSDARRSPDGTLQTPHFPHGDEFPIESYVDLLQQIDGFSTLPVIYVPINRTISSASIPPPAETLESDASIQLVDVSQQNCGARIPVDADFDVEGGRFSQPRTLRVATAYGFPLRPDRTYALLVRRNFGNPDNAGTLASQSAQRALSGEVSDDAPAPLRAWNKSLQPLRRCADESDISLDKIGIATVFTTQNPVEPMVKLQSAAQDPDISGTPTVSDWRRWEKHSDSEVRTVYRATFEAPMFQRGEPPFVNKGGFGLLDGEQLQVQSRQTVPFNLSIPVDASPPYPLIIWQPGTGGDAESTIGQAHLDALIQRGFAIATFTPPFHGARPGSSAPITNTFNYLNGRAGRSNIRQQAAETTYFIRVLKSAVNSVADRPDLEFEPLIYGGQSQGAVVGSILAGVEPAIDVVAFNGVGGYFATSVLYRNDDFIDVQQLLRDSLGIDRTIDRYSLVVQMAQTIVDVGDPLNFARRWKGWEAHPSGTHALLINGSDDQTFTQNAMNSLAIAAGIPPVDDPGWPYDPRNLVDLDPLDLPVSGNASAIDDTPLTLGTRMVQGTGHFTIFRHPPAAELLVNFLDSTRSPDSPPPTITRTSP